MGLTGFFSRRYYWPGFAEDATAYEKICDFCRHRDSGAGLVKPAKSILASRPNQRWQIDLKLDMPFTYITNDGYIKTEKAHGVNVVDCFSRFLMSRLVTTKEDDAILNQFDKLVLQSGHWPQILQMDNGTYVF